jgi:hypothetical protein
MRWPDVEAEIGRILTLPESDWIGTAADLRSETLVFLIRESRGGKTEVLGRLVRELSKRIISRVTYLTRELPPMAAEEVTLQVEMDVLELVLTGDSSRRGEYLEVSFGVSIRMRTSSVIETHARRNSFLVGCLDDIITYDDDGEATERRLPLTAREWPNPETILLGKEEDDRRQVCVQKAYGAVSVRTMEAVLLHYAYGWPLASKKPHKQNLARHFKSTASQMRYRIAKALKAMRTAVDKRSPRRRGDSELTFRSR